MSESFGIYFAAHDEAGVLHQFVPGDVVPEWLADRVGPHCLVAVVEVPVVAVVPDADDDADDDAGKVADEAPDFTGTKPAGRKK